MEPLGRLQLEAVPCGMSTTEDRLTMRLRLAGEDQLGAYTPRPRAMSDSVFQFSGPSVGAEQRVGEARPRWPQVRLAGAVRLDWQQAEPVGCYVARRLA